MNALRLAAVAAILIVPPVRRRALAVSRVAVSSVVGIAYTAVRGGADIAQAAMTGHDDPMPARGAR
jgi:hypothetical protein